jgi:lysophospholipase L1-like esterase
MRAAGRAHLYDRRMKRVGYIALAAFAVLDIVAAVYVVRHNRAPRHSLGVAALSARTPSRSVAPRTTVSSSVSAVSAPLPTSAATQAGAGGLVVAFVGDDWTAGVGASGNKVRFSTLVSTDLHLVERNFGVDGTGYAKSSATGGGYRSRVKAVVAAGPQVVVVSGGRNDASDDPGTAAAQIEQLFTDLHAKLPNAAVVAVAPFWGDSDLPPELATLGRAIKSSVTEAGGTYLDLADPIHNHPGYMADAADPNDRGYAAIAAALRPRLAPLLPD